MLRKTLLAFLLFLPFMLLAQVNPKPVRNGKSSSIMRSNEKSSRDNNVSSAANDTVAAIDMYKIITLDRDTTYVDTSLTIKNDYKANYLRKDNFGLLPFPNEGQPYNILDYGLMRYNPFPEFGFKAKHFAYMEVDDINYYHVATPFTDLFYKSVLEQGQILDAFITANTSENLNMAVAYKGLRSIGKYINSIASNGNFRLIGSYNTTDKRYILKAHFTAQDFSNQENGGITDTSLFESSEEPYNERERLDVYFRNATSLLKGNRYFFDHTFRLSKSNPNSIVLHHQFNYENKSFQYSQPTASERLGETYATSVNNKTRYNRMYNMLGAAYSNEKLGAVEFYLEDYNYNYYYRRVIFEGQDVGIPNSLNDRVVAYGARYTYQKNRLKGNILFSNSLTDQSLTNISAFARYTFDEDNVVSFRYQNMNKLPDLNYRLYQSSYVNYNWYNSFKNEKINSFEFDARTKWLDASLQYTVLNDYLYFDSELTEPSDPDGVTQLMTSPAQYDGTINYLSLKASKDFHFGKFGLDNTVLYQKVVQDEGILNVPELVTRNTLYFSDYLFKKALFIQTGITFQYFTEYNANGYNPLIGEFYVQEREKIGNFPLMDFFINAKVKQFRVFLKAEHFNSSFTGYNFYSAPDYPYRDFTVRFGVIWDFFS